MRNNWLIAFLLGAALASRATGAVAFEPPAFSRFDSLFLAAATGEPRFQALRDSCEKELVARGDSTLEYLAARRLTGQTPRQAHYVERLFTVLSDSGRNPAPRRVLARALENAPHDTARAQLLYIGSAIGDSAFREVAILWINRSSSPLVRRMGLRSISQYPKPQDKGALLNLLSRSEGLERHQTLRALSKHGKVEAPAEFARCLDDPWFYNRRLARDLLLLATDSTWSRIAPLMQAIQLKEQRREWWLVALEAKGGETYLRGQRALMTPEERVFFGVK